MQTARLQKIDVEYDLLTNAALTNAAFNEAAQAFVPKYAVDVVRGICKTCGNTLMIMQRNFCSRQCEEIKHPVQIYRIATARQLAQRARFNLPVNCFKCKVEIKEGDVCVTLHKHHMLYCKKCYDNRSI
jgi:hypothetical protein